MRLSLSAPLLASGLMLCFTSSHGDWTSPHPLQQEKAAPVPLIPFPSQVDWKTGTCPKKAPVSVKKNASLSKTLGKEGYELRIRPNGILITAADDAGVFMPAERWTSWEPGEITRAATSRTAPRSPSGASCMTQAAISGLLKHSRRILMKWPG